MEKCTWTYDGEYYDYYYTSCGNDFVFTEGTIKDHGFKYCPYCGKEIEENQETED